MDNAQWSENWTAILHQQGKSVKHYSKTYIYIYPFHSLVKLLKYILQTHKDEKCVKKFIVGKDPGNYI